MSEIYKIKMELTKNEYDRLCELLNIDIGFLQPTRKEPNTFSKDIMRKMKVKIKERHSKDKKDYFHVCATCAYRKNIYGYSQCYAQKNAPKIENLDDSCDAWKASDEE